MKLDKEDVDKLLNWLESTRGKRISIHESLSRARQLGHDRHFTTDSAFTLTVSNFSGINSESQINLEQDQDFSYAIAADVISDFKIEDSSKKLIINEHFEQETERRTTIRILES
ncbi:MAG TPA: hypothetical protein VJZ27_01560 [Aggregatilineales bacterium]|nr:hypothetical protein [Aggregatilineales bacterium]